MGPKNIAGNAYAIQRRDVAMVEPVTVNNWVKRRKFMMLTVNWDKI